MRTTAELIRKTINIDIVYWINRFKTVPFLDFLGGIDDSIDTIPEDLENVMFEKIQSFVQLLLTYSALAIGMIAVPILLAIWMTLPEDRFPLMSTVGWLSTVSIIAIVTQSICLVLKKRYEIQKTKAVTKEEVKKIATDVSSKTAEEVARNTSAEMIKQMPCTEHEIMSSDDIKNVLKNAGF